MKLADNRSVYMSFSKMTICLCEQYLVPGLWFLILQQLLFVRVGQIRSHNGNYFTIDTITQNYLLF